MIDVISASFDSNDECNFGTPFFVVESDFYNLYRAQLGLCTVKLNSTSVSGYVGYSECKGLYMRQHYVSIPFYGQTPKALVKRFKRIVKLLEQNK